MRSTSSRRSVENLRCPAIQGLSPDTVHILHKSMTQLVRLPRSLEAADIQIERAREMVLETQELLARHRKNGV
jgi:hypothetical protein